MLRSACEWHIVYICNCVASVGANGPLVFVAMPRLEQGVPMTVGFVTDVVSKEGNPLIAPYPDWEWNRLGDCDAITSTYRVQVRMAFITN